MASEFLDFSVRVALILLSASFLVTVLKVIKGPTLPDRVLALDMLVATAIGFIAVLGIKTGYTLYLDIAIALGLVGFLATVAFSRFILMRGVSEDDTNSTEAQAEAAPMKATPEERPKKEPLGKKPAGRKKAAARKPARSVKK